MSPASVSGDRSLGAKASPLTLADLADSPVQPAAAGGGGPAERSFTLMMQAAGSADGALDRRSRSPLLPHTHPSSPLLTAGWMIGWRSATCVSSSFGCARGH
jgi:hypothetical protein